MLVNSDISSFEAPLKLLKNIIKLLRKLNKLEGESYKPIISYIIVSISYRITQEPVKVL